MIQTVRNLSARIETLISKTASPLKPVIPVIARFLLVVTFFEDSLRIIAQWSDQLVYLERYRGFYNGANHIFLGLNVFVSMILQTEKMVRYGYHGYTFIHDNTAVIHVVTPASTITRSRKS
ncbi:ER-derived vesicles protein erv29 [Basidiobolus ranarum]|uniref:ER-derived vesicles protein erv29 n=1 Tax=Basidiobolus ranarum TaxID=34480 RepID=A0ABR2VVC3_9FUNG